MLKLRKVFGDDLIINEYIIYGGKIFVGCFLKLFIVIVVYDYILFCWKCGFIVLLYKGGVKLKDFCNSYRLVVLLLCVFKFFEKVVYN